MCHHCIIFLASFFQSLNFLRLLAVLNISERVQTDLSSFHRSMMFSPGYYIVRDLTKKKPYKKIIRIFLYQLLMFLSEFELLFCPLTKLE